MSNFQPQGKIWLIKDVDIDNSYTHQYYFANSDRQWDFFVSKAFKTLENGTYQRKNINTMSVPYSADEISECKYIMWTNQNFSAKPYFAFVTSINYENPKTSIIKYQLDVYQTYLFDMEWKESFVEREHCRRYTSSEKTTPIVNVELENLDYGSEYKVLSKTSISQVLDGDVVFAVLGCKKYSPGSGDSSYFATNMNYFIVPIWIGNNSLRTFRLNTATLTTFPAVLKFFANDTTYVNTLVSLYITPYIPLTIDATNYSAYVSLQCGNLNAINLTGDSTITVATITGDYANVLESLPFNMGNKYSDFPSYDESKLLMYPYSFTELTDFRGDTKIIKMEYINDTNLFINILTTISTANKLVATVSYYLTESGYTIEESLVDSNSNTLPILDDYSASYLQANKNSYYAGLITSRLTAITELNNSQRTATSGLQKIGNDKLATWANYAIDTAQGIGNLATNNLSKAIGNLAEASTTYVSGMNNATNDLIDVDTNLANSLASISNNVAVADELALAKIQDTKMVPPEVSQLGGDTLFNVSYDCDKIYILKKTITDEYVTKLTNYFKQYGYKVNKLESPNFHSRSRYNYIRMSEPNVYGNIPMDDLSSIRGIFTKGITLWHGDYIGDYTTDNPEV